MSEQVHIFLATQLVGSQFLQWKPGILTTRAPGSSQNKSIFIHLHTDASRGLEEVILVVILSMDGIYTMLSSHHCFLHGGA